MNRKGFAITTVVYGLALLGIMIVTMLMGILSSTRNNITQESERIESTLINYNLSSVKYKYKNTEQSFETPNGETGWYRIEAYGASGLIMPSEPVEPVYTGTEEEKEAAQKEYKKKLEEYNDQINSTSYGLGAFTTGIIYLYEGDIVTIITGKNSPSEYEKQKSNTIVRINGKDIMIAAGGVKDSATHGTPGGTLKTQSSEAMGPEIARETCQITNADNDLIGGASITYGGTKGNTSMIVGYPGCGINKIINDSKEYYFVNGLMLPAVHNGDGMVIIERIKEDTEYYEGKIYNSSKLDSEAEAVLDKPINRIPRTNHKFDNVKGIKATITSLGENPDLSIDKIYYTVDGVEKVINCNSTTCNESFPSNINIDDITVTFNKYNINLGGVRIRLIKDGDIDSESYVKNLIYDSTIRKKGTRYNSGIYSTPVGIKLSAYQPDSLQALPKHGNYYIIPVTLENKVISAVSTTQDDSGIIGVEHLQGEPRQRWAIDLLNYANATTGEPNFVNIANVSGMDEYRIIDLARSKALTVYRDENRNGGTISASQNFNAISRNTPQIWNIAFMSDGTFAIKTAEQSLNSAIRSGYIYVNTTKHSDHQGKILIGNEDKDLDNRSSTCDNDNCIFPTTVERFRLYSIDFSTTT